MFIGVAVVTRPAPESVASTASATVRALPRGKRRQNHWF